MRLYRPNNSELLRKLSVDQQRVLATYGVKLLGFDARLRPVVEQRERWGTAMIQWAVCKNGSPGEIKEVE